MKYFTKLTMATLLGVIMLSSVLTAQVNMDNYITLTVENGEDIKLDLAANADNTPIKIVSGSKEYNIITDTIGTWFVDYTSGAEEMTIYGNVKRLDCSSNLAKITGLDASHNSIVEMLWTNSNQLTSLDVSNCVNLKNFYCSGNQLTNLDVSQCINLIWFNCSYNQLIDLDVSQCVNLLQFDCFDNPFTTNTVNNIFCSLPDRTGLSSSEIHILGGISSASVVLAANKQNALDKNWKVKYYNGTDIPATTGSYECGTILPVTGVSLSHNELTLYEGYSKQIKSTLEPLEATTPGVTWFSSDSTIATVNNGLVTAVSPGNAIITVITEDGGYTDTCEVTVEAFGVNMDCYITLNVVEGEDIGLLLVADFDSIPIKIVSGSQEYDVEINTSWHPPFSVFTAGDSIMTIYGYVKWFNCGENGAKLTNVDASHNPNLEKLYCHYNQLSSLDISQNTNLKMLRADNNQLSSLDLSQNTKLEKLYCNNNQLTSLDFTHNLRLEYVLCCDNPLITEAVDSLFCSLPDKSISDNARLYILNDTTDANYADVIASNKQNAVDKNWKVLYQDFNGTFGDLHGTNILTTGNYECPAIPVTGVSLTTENIALDVNETSQLVATVQPENATNTNVVWSSSNDNIATVDNKGLVTAVASGNVVITVIAEDGGFSDTCNVTVNNANEITTPENINNLTLYPNPVNGLLNIESSTAIHKIEVFNYLGQLIDAVNINNKAYQYHTEKLNVGYYMFKIHTNNGVAVEKVMKR